MQPISRLGLGDKTRRLASFFTLMVAAALLAPAVCSAASGPAVTTATPGVQFAQSAAGQSADSFDWGAGGYTPAPLTLPSDGGAQFAVSSSRCR